MHMEIRDPTTQDSNHHRVRGLVDRNCPLVVKLCRIATDTCCFHIKPPWLWDSSLRGSHGQCRACPRTFLRVARTGSTAAQMWPRLILRGRDHVPATAHRQRSLSNTPRWVN